MASMSRRTFLRETAAAGILAAAAPRLRASPLGLPIGSQVYPTRSMLKDFPAYVKMMAGIGVTRLELCSPIGYGAEFAALTSGRDVRTTLADHGMKAESSHFSLRELRTTQQQSIDWAKDVGITQMVTATLADGNGGNSPTLDQVKRAADEYNAIAAVAARAGMQQGLHNEGFESATIDGRRVYDLLLELLDPKLVKFQFQMSTITAGFSGAGYFEKFPGRFNSMHLQDIDMNAPLPTPPPGGPPARRPQVAVGQGSIDWVKTFRAAKAAGVQSFYVEQSWELTRQSVAYLETLAV
jgi:sugar phosphate isomerase/epimerase